jgi:zinc protease
MGNYHYRRTAPSLEKINQVSVARANEIYKERFADASDFTFVFTGSFTVDAIKPLLEQYLGSLPALHRHEKAIDLGIRMPQGQVSKTIYKGQEQKATVSLIYHGVYKAGNMLNLQLGALKEALTLRLTERLREKEGGVYTPNIVMGYRKFPDHVYMINISFGCAPENVDKLIAAAKEEIRQLMENGPTETEVQKYVAEAKRSVEMAWPTNEYWHNKITNALQNGEDPAEMIDVLKRVNQVTVQGMKEAAREYLKGDNILQFVLMPEKE